MTREEFIKAYAERSGLNAEYAILGFIDCGVRVRIALPCACGEEICQGWAMISAEGVDDHLRFKAPDYLSAAYCLAVDGVVVGEEMQ